MLGSIFRYVQGIVKLKGGTDNTAIGNVGDRLKVDSSTTIPQTMDCPTLDSSITDVPLNPFASGYTDIYLYSGSGVVYEFSIGVNNENVWLGLEIDGTVCFETIVSHHHSIDANASLKPGNSMFTYQKDKRIINLSPQYPIPYTTSVKLVGKATDTNTGRKAVEYVILLSKDT